MSLDSLVQAQPWDALKHPAHAAHNVIFYSVIYQPAARHCKQPRHDRTLLAQLFAPPGDNVCMGEALPPASLLTLLPTLSLERVSDTAMTRSE